MRRVRKIVALARIEEYLDYLENCGILECVFEIAHVDTSLSDEFCGATQ
jgi:hypothetical protein